MIRCVRCNTVKPRSEYYQSINLSWCKQCRRSYRSAKYAALSPGEKAEASRIATIKREARKSA